MLGWIKHFTRYGLVPHGLPIWLGMFMSMLSVVALIQYGFDYGLGPTLTRLLEYYDAFISIPAGWVEPWIDKTIIWLNSLVNWELQLQPHWKHILVLLGIYFFRDATDIFRDGIPGTSVFQVLSGLLIALLTSVAAGTIPVTATHMGANFLIAAIPVVGVFIYDSGVALWVATFLRDQSKQIRHVVAQSWWATFRVNMTWNLRTTISALVLIGLGLQVPAIQRLPSPGLALLAGLVGILAVYLLWLGTIDANSIRQENESLQDAYWRTGGPRLGAAMFGLVFWIVLFLVANAGLGLIGL